jgi:AmmeMemoRadiSam system protein A
MSIACAVLMCHAPIVIPAIAARQAGACSATTEAMRKAARTLVAHEPSLIVLISPHAPRRPRSIGITCEEVLYGDFARFGQPNIALRFLGAPEQARLLVEHASQQGVPTHALSGHALDHGSLVPLFFVQEAGYRGHVLIASLPYPGADLEASFGAALRTAADVSRQRWAILASGDMSHRLTRDAPAGFEPRAHEFDRGFARALRHGDLRAALDVDPALQELAAEDVVQSTAVAAAALQYASDGIEVLGYEAPFGVGYLEAQLFSLGAAATGVHERPQSSTAPPALLVDIALEAIEHALSGAPYCAPPLPAPWDEPRAVFVTLRSPDGSLRGCIGRTEPMAQSLSEEVADCAVGAATRDLRMEALRSDELPDLRVEVSVLHAPRAVEDREKLDPRQDGIVVELGLRRGVLLPDVEGVDSVAQQIRIALGKAGIAEHSPYTLSSFRVDKVRRELAPPLLPAQGEQKRA